MALRKKSAAKAAKPRTRKPRAKRMPAVESVETKRSLSQIRAQIITLWDGVAALDAAAGRAVNWLEGTGSVDDLPESSRPTDFDRDLGIVAQLGNDVLAIQEIVVGVSDLLKRINAAIG